MLSKKEECGLYVLIFIINNLYCAFSAVIQRRFTRDSQLLKLKNDSVKSLSTEGLEVNFNKWLKFLLLRLQFADQLQICEYIVAGQWVMY